MEMKMPKTKTAKGRALKIPANSPAPTGTSHAHTHTPASESDSRGLEQRTHARKCRTVPPDGNDGSLKLGGSYPTMPRQSPKMQVKP